MATYDSGPISSHSVVSHDKWLSARTALLEREKAFSHARDEVNRLRRELPWEKVEKQYEFDGPNGRETLADLFKDCRQLVVYHFMFAPGANEGCAHCSFWAESFDALAAHLEHRDTTFVAISRAPLAALEAFKRRMGWKFKWVSSDDGDFNYDLGVSFRPEDRKKGTAVYNYRPGESGADREGASVFYKGEDGTIYHTYSTYARGIDLLNVTYNFLDLTPKGRDEAHLSDSQAWVRYKDKYPPAS
jgi:predicted dithiol-disulfide oxidoreductase (DUF899 family)